MAQHNGITFTREMHLFPKSLKGEINAWCARDLAGTLHYFKTRKEMCGWIDEWLKEVGVIRANIGYGTFHKYEIQNGEFVCAETTKEEWLAQREGRK